MVAHRLEQAINSLSKEIQINHFNNVKNIDVKLAKIMAFNDCSVIRPLVRLIEDNAQYDEAVFLIIHSIESFENDVYINEIINEFPYLVKKAHNWATILLIRILNSNTARECMIDKVSLTTSAIKNSILFLLQRINAEKTNFYEKTASLMKVINPI
ncbi:Imm30 family immunity protein [Acinetobacter gerneri]|uniref:Imm30 family immunity protein n=1 Tax=Acinetobacter gerneri TaxID=202952 RepID=A0AAW8JIV3_9GAMM|nr:Imm30 family immunity protein [Acinetobacter gerneri]MDQ9010114.1 Imm30 family immunity protein [Acinetobacter gerneri]MDQ9014281.1 Imm30 family immunity protein [Acinetobacter gerneri]MDQ9025392.1 Imm30 family immunity protein [Acinetobacter gerneri]MDQ9052733.1 Imm30 family immunity protein [Acinetobacter gerneri]MDQ9060351.1 Imm30 family immunity protein [Acinetobacter gerneri]